MAAPLPVEWTTTTSRGHGVRCCAERAQEKAPYGAFSMIAMALTWRTRSVRIPLEIEVHSPGYRPAQLINRWVTASATPLHRLTTRRQTKSHR